MSNHIATVKATFEDFIERNSVDAMLASVTEDVVLKNAIPEWAPFGGEFHGKAGLLDYFEKVATVLEIHSVRALDYFESGDQIVVLGDEVLKIKSSGEEFSSEWCTVFVFRGDKISKIRVLEDHSPLCVALAKNA